MNQSETSLSEEIAGDYSVFLYQFDIKGGKRLLLEPYGLYLVGAKARAEIVGPSGQESIVYLYEGGPALAVHESYSGSTTVKEKTSEYGYRSEGWYWFDDPVRGDLLPFDKSVFFQDLEPSHMNTDPILEIYATYLHLDDALKIARRAVDRLGNEKESDRML